MGEEVLHIALLARGEGVRGAEQEKGSLAQGEAGARKMGLHVAHGVFKSFAQVHK